jgi:NADH-quinone oxidoreductase subunit B
VLFLLPFAVAFTALPAGALIAMLIFILLLAEGLVWAWHRGHLEWNDMSDPAPPPAALTDAERDELRRQGILLTSLEELYNWGRSHSVWPLQFGLACCAIEMIAASMARFDIARFGSEVFRPSPRQADLLIVSGTVTKKMAPQVVRLWNQMPEPKVLHRHGRLRDLRRALQAGLQRAQGHRPLHPGRHLHPRLPAAPEALLHGLMQLQEKIRGQARPAPTAAPLRRERATSRCRTSASTTSRRRNNPEVWQAPVIVRKEGA